MSAAVPRLLLIDNYDSFTYNLVQAFMVLGAEVLVYRNDALEPAAAEALAPTHLCISPGPGTPQQAGVSIAMIRAFAGRIPVFGVCLGHQAIVTCFGGEVGRAHELVHGKATSVRHDGSAFFRDVPSEFDAGRYHSLAATSLPDCLEVTASTSDGEVMAVRHRALPVIGVQFHPESVLTPNGPELARNFLAGAL